MYSTTPVGLLTAGGGGPSGTTATGPLTLTVLGCGAMGTAILSGILASIAELDAPRPLQMVPSSSSVSGLSGTSAAAAAASGTTTPAEEVPERLPGRFIACVRRTESAKRVKAALWEHSSALKVVQNDNVHAVQMADVIVLACKAHAVEAILAEPGMVRALHGKLLISICAGISVAQIEGCLHGGTVPTLDPEVDGRCRVVRAMPNAAALIRESMTVIAVPDSHTSESSTGPATGSTTGSTHGLPTATAALVTWIFRRIGDVAYLPSAAMDASTALCASGPAFFALMLEASIDGAVAMGLPRAEAQRMAAQAMRGTAGLVLHGDHPALLRDRISTPGGCTIGGLMVLEEGNVRGTVSRAVREATTVASQLGKGAEGVNGTRFS